MAALAETLRFTVDDYHRMVDAGILAEDDPVELVEGQILMMAPVGSRHAAHVKRLNRLLTFELGTRAIVAVQDPITVDDFSEPEPDLSLLRPRDDFYAAAHPRPEDVFWLVEVSHTSLEVDREVKLPLYARHRIPEVWVVDVAAAVLEVFRSPENGRYRERSKVEKGQTISALAFPDLSFAVQAILG
ncbi:MAG: Uma2 family endonuclease [Acidobacteriota bacterium]